MRRRRRRGTQVQQMEAGLCNFLQYNDHVYAPPRGIRYFSGFSGPDPLYLSDTDPDPSFFS
jgi:hypothetical protein